MLGLAETRMGRYRLSRRLGEGGMAEVFLGFDEEMHRAVAVKVVDSREFDLRRFQREVETIGSLAHEHILPVFDYGEQDEWRYLVMQYVEGGTLRERLQDGPLAPEEAAHILRQVASALRFAHARGIIHRDIKPSNILLRGSYAYLADFGLARSLNLASSLTKTGILLGTPEYLAPELADKEATTSADIYALGIVLYQMLTGHVPFSGSTLLAIYWKHVQEAPIPPSSLNPALPASVDAVVLRALAKDPRERFQTAGELARAFDMALEGAQQSRTLADTDAQKLQPLMHGLHLFHRRSNYRHVLLIVLLFLLTAALSLAFLAFNDSPQPRPSPVWQFYPSSLPPGTLHQPAQPTQPATPTAQPTTTKPPYSTITSRPSPTPQVKPTPAKPTPTPAKPAPTPTPTLTPTPTPPPWWHKHRRGKRGLY